MMQEIFSKKLLTGREISTIVDSSWLELRKKVFLCSVFQEHLVSLKIDLKYKHGLAMFILGEPESIALYTDKKPEEWIQIAAEEFNRIKDITIPVLGANWFKK